MKSLDLSPLKGRKIVIDPGHGGRFKGAVGARGLRESDINLAVGLHLWGLLKQAGARVWMTRTADVDLCSQKEANLKEDLDARSWFSNNLKAEIFISIHHNSDIKNRKKNNFQIYYKLTDPGPSQDLALCIASEFKQGLSPENVFIYPGNYRVLRNTKAIAILGEASYISNPKNEKRLSLSNQLRREAEDYFLGILRYFQKGIPKVADLHPDGETIETAFPRIEARIIGGEGGKAIAYETVKLYLDGMLVPARFDNSSGKIIYAPNTPLKNGWHTFSVWTRNRNGNSCWDSRARFFLSLPPTKIKVYPSFSAIPADGKSSSRIEIEVLDCYGNPVIDGSEVLLKASAGRLEKGKVFTQNGQALTYFFSPQEPKEVEILVQCQEAIGKTIIKCGPVNYGLVRITIMDDHHQPIDKVRILKGEVLLGISDLNGLVFVSSDRSGELPVTIKRTGYIDKRELILFQPGTFREEHFYLTPRENGVLLGRKFTLDPEPQDEHTEKEFNLHPKAEKVNLLVAKKLKDFLECSGATVALTRNFLHQHPTPGERVLVGEKFAGDFFLTLTHRKGRSFIAHYFNSQTGKKLAQTLAQVLKKELKLKKVTVKEGNDFTIIHPRAPSVIINFGKRSLKKVKNWQKIVEEEALGAYRGLVVFLHKNS